MESTQAQHSDLGALVINGLVSGVGAGLVMAGLLAVLTLAGLTPDPAALLLPDMPLLGALAQHLAVSGVYGIVFVGAFTALRKRISLPWVGAGLAYGLLLVGIARLVVLPGFQSFPFGALAAAHLLYGGVLGLLSRATVTLSGR